MHHQISNPIPAISICCFSKGFCISFTRITSPDVIYYHLSAFSFNRYDCYLTIIFCLLVSNIVILDRFSQLIQIVFTKPENSPGASILHLLYKNTLIFHNNTSLDCLKLQVLLFYAKLLFSIGQTIDILVKNVQQKELMFINSNCGHGLQDVYWKFS